MNEINSSSFNEMRNCVVLVYTNMCGTCKNARVMLNVVSQMMKEINFSQINANLYPEVLKKFKIESIPCFLIFKDSVLIEQFYAFHSVTFLYDKFNKLF